MTPQIFTGLYPHMASGYLSRPIATSDAEMPDKILQTVGKYFKVQETEMKGSCRKRNFTEARQVAMYFFTKKTRLQLVKIGEEFNRHHSTVIYARETVEDIMATNKFFKAKVEEIAELLKN